MSGPADPPGCAAAALAMAGATLPVAAGLMIVDGGPGLFIPIFVVSLATVALFGSLGFLLIRERVTVARVVAAGFATGSIVPILIMLAAPESIVATGLIEALGYGAAGGAAALIAWLLLVWQTRQEFAPVVIVGFVLLGVPVLAIVL